MAHTPNEESKAKKTFSGKLPFRTTSEKHEDIYHAAKREGMSINAWMDKSLAAAAQHVPVETEAADATAADAMNWLMQADPQGFFKLIDQVQPRLKQQKVNDAVLWLSHVQKLLKDFDRLQNHFPNAIRFSVYLEQSVIPELAQLQDVPPNQQFLKLCARLMDGFAMQGADRNLDFRILISFIDDLNTLRNELINMEIVYLLEALLELSQCLEDLFDKYLEK
ncbi:toxin-antitoxin system HicB family antitoxin [filamentous cyanobacterium LEGE 11480]|uniref:Toxin-antitoxin system HicB family antitoxin n=2 Tax=Romeriopsis TaxID=2992131 RepID=A0A928VS54_9CYAN|nr:toxin-antitoxin system HicB family antitoxin [Romeriopsis navalis LEGE 11480]